MTWSQGWLASTYYFLYDFFWVCKILPSCAQQLLPPVPLSRLLPVYWKHCLCSERKYLGLSHPFCVSKLRMRLSALLMTPMQVLFWASVHILIRPLGPQGKWWYFHLKFCFATHQQILLHAYTGLASYIFTNNVQRSWRVSEALEYGLVGVNEGLISTEVGPTLHPPVSFLNYILVYSWLSV